MRYTGVMKRFFHAFFQVLGVIFFLFICVGVYLWIADPFKIRPLLDGVLSDVGTVTTTAREGVSDTVIVDKNPVLNAAQERALEVVGIDPAKVPTTITPEQEKCFTEKLGEKRVVEIKAGGAPSASEVFKARECIK